MSLSPQEILRAYEEEYRPFGKSRDDLAKDLGLSFQSLKYKLEKARRKAPISDESVKVEDDGKNYKVLTGGKRITTLEQLLEICNLSLDEWHVSKVVANKWEGYRSNKRVNVVYEDGFIVEGSIEDDGGIFTAPLIQIKAWLVRKKPLEVKPAVKPIIIKSKVNPNIISKNLSRKSISRKFLVLFDSQIGFSRDVRTGELNSFHDRRALSVALEVAIAERPDEVIWGGDHLDLPEWTDAFLRGPDIHAVMQPAIYENSWWLDKFSIFTKKQIVLPGNHEIRIEKALFKHLSSAYDLRSVGGADGKLKVKEFPSLSIPGLLGFDERDIEWIDGYPDNKYWINEHFSIEHGKKSSSKPGGTANLMLSGASYSVAFGHIHRMEQATSFVRSKEGRRIIHAICPGCLCKIDGSVPGHDLNQNWNQGILLINEFDDGTTVPEHIPIYDGVGYAHDRTFEGEDYSEEIESVEGVGFF